jgi:hypothetical protein
MSLLVIDEFHFIILNPYFLIKLSESSSFFVKLCVIIISSLDERI